MKQARWQTAAAQVKVGDLEFLRRGRRKKKNKQKKPVLNPTEGRLVLVETFKILSSVTFVQSRALSGDVGGGWGGGGGVHTQRAPKICSICQNVTLLCVRCVRASAPASGKGKRKALAAAATGE